jgi:hypothetical protein
MWGMVDRLVEWLDENSELPTDINKLMRVIKLSEEIGEVSQALIGVTGQNPRKGVTHTWDDVHAELCDVILTAMVALRTLTPEAPKILAAHLETVTRRSLS